MFNQILGLILALILIGFSDDTSLPTSEVHDHILGILLGSYLLLLWVIFQQGKRDSEWLLMAVQVELLLFLGFAVFFLHLGALFSWLPLPQSTLLVTGLAIYGGGLVVYHWAALGSIFSAMRQVLLLMPLAFPFFLLTLFSDISPLFFSGDYLFGWPSGLMVAVLLVAVLIAFPPLLVRLWLCSPIEDAHLREELEQVCRHAQFRHGGICLWGVMGTIPNAAIIGLIPRWRYLLLSPRLVQLLSVNELKAVLAHEIGHSQQHHLLFYPYILLGMSISALLTLNVSIVILEHFIGLHSLVQPVLFILFALVTALYFRFVFGYFSRLFERAADLYGPVVGITHQQMALALESLARASGIPLESPSWHHGSMAERVRFLLNADANAAMRHRRHIYWALFCYTIGLLSAFFGMVYFF